MFLGVAVRVERDTNDLEVRLRFWKSRFFNLESVNIIGVFDILIND